MIEITNGHDLEHLHILARAMDQSASLVFITDAQGRIEYVNSRFTQVTGYTPQQAVGQTPRILKSGDKPASHYAAMWQAILSGQDWQGEFRNKTRDGHHYWASASITPIVDAAGAITHFLAIQEDISERKRAEQAERAQRALAEALRDSAQALTSTLDQNQVLDRILESVGRVVPHEAADMMLLAGDSVRVVRAQGYDAFGQRDALLKERFSLAETTNLRWMAETGQPLTIPDTRDYPGWVVVAPAEWVRSYVGAPIRLRGEVIGFLSLSSATPGFYTPEHAAALRDFADQAAIAIRNARLYADLEARNRELDAFGHTVAHDLKTPLHLIMGNAGLLAMEPAALDPDSLSAVEQIQTSSAVMVEMIEQLLLLATVRDASRLAKRVNMQPVVSAALARLEHRIAERGVRVEVAPDLPPVLGHAPWLEEVFVNLVSNAIKYIGADNPEPRIAIGGTSHEGRVTFTVHDNGVGMGVEDLPRAFEMFSRFHIHEAKGMGLGLSIVQHIVSRLGGEVGVESAPGQGSSFWFWLPAPD